MALVGDAAGYVTKCSGEGIYFAAKSGRMAAEAVVDCVRKTGKLPTEKQMKQTYIKDYDKLYKPTYLVLDILQKVKTVECLNIQNIWSFMRNSCVKTQQIFLFTSLLCCVSFYTRLVLCVRFCHFQVFYSNNAAREAFVELCESEYVQKVTFDSYLYKKVRTCITQSSCSNSRVILHAAILTESTKKAFL